MSAATATAALLAVVCVLMSCQTYRVEYRLRPAFYDQASTEPLPSRVTLDDGTIIIYENADERKLRREKKSPAILSDAKEEEKKLELREQLEDGTIILRAFLPDHVLAHVLVCLRNEEYELLYDQMLAQPTKNAYESRGLGRQGFIDYMTRYRRDILVTMNRLIRSAMGHDVVMESIGRNVIRVRLHPNVAETHVFKSVDVVSEGRQFRLLRIQ